MHYKNFKKCCDYKNENVYFPVMGLKFKQRGCLYDINFRWRGFDY